MIDRIKREPGNDLLPYGGATFDQALSRFLLVDDRRMIQPAALGAGLYLFGDLPAPPLQLNLVEANTYASGVSIHVYRPAGQLESLRERCADPRGVPAAEVAGIPAASLSSRRIRGPDVLAATDPN